MAHPTAPQARRGSRSIALVIALILAPVTLAAQAVATPQSPPETQSSRLKSDLRNLITAQEARYADRGAYAPSVAELGTQAYKVSEGSRVEIVNFTPNGYGAVARAAGFSGSCVVHIGIAAATAPRTETEQKHFPEGEPACDGDGIDAASRWASAAELQAFRTLARVAKLQERHLGRTGAYATATASLEGLTVPPTLTLTIDAPPNSRFGPAFVASVVDSRYPTQSCVVRSGNGSFGSRALTTGERRPTRVDLQVVCDTFK